jgi:hypothetical protein
MVSGPFCKRTGKMLSFLWDLQVLKLKIADLTLSKALPMQTATSHLRQDTRRGTLTNNIFEPGI